MDLLVITKKKGYSWYVMTVDSFMELSEKRRFTMTKEPSANENPAESKSPEKILEISRVVSETLRMLNEVYRQQHSIVAAAVELSREMISLVEERSACRYTGRYYIDLEIN